MRAKSWLLVAGVAGLTFVGFISPGEPRAATDQDKIEKLLTQGNEFALQGDLDGALSTYKKVLALDEHNALAHNNLGIIYKRKGLYISATEEFKAALEALPEYFKAYNNLANVYYDRGYYDEAVKYYNKALGVKPNFADAHWNLGLAYEKKGETSRAISHFRKFAELSDQPAYVALAQQHIDALTRKPEPEPEPAPAGTAGTAEATVAP